MTPLAFEQEEDHAFRRLSHPLHQHTRAARIRRVHLRAARLFRGPQPRPGHRRARAPCGCGRASPCVLERAARRGGRAVSTSGIQRSGPPWAADTCGTVPGRDAARPRGPRLCVQGGPGGASRCRYAARGWSLLRDSAGVGDGVAGRRTTLGRAVGLPRLSGGAYWRSGFRLIGGWRRALQGRAGDGPVRAAVPRRQRRHPPPRWRARLHGHGARPLRPLPRGGRPGTAPEGRRGRRRARPHRGRHPQLGVPPVSRALRRTLPLRGGASGLHRSPRREAGPGGRLLHVLSRLHRPTPPRRVAVLHAGGVGHRQGDDAR